MEWSTFVEFQFPVDLERCSYVMDISCACEGEQRGGDIIFMFTFVNMRGQVSTPASCFSSMQKIREREREKKSGGFMETNFDLLAI